MNNSNKIKYKILKYHKKHINNHTIRLRSKQKKKWMNTTKITYIII